MALSSLALKTVLLIAEVVVGLLLLRLDSPSSLAVLFVVVQLLRIHLRKLLHSHLKICDQSITPAPRKVLPDDHAHHLHLIGVRCHCVRRHDPTSLAQLVCDRELIELMSMLRVETEGHKWQTLALSLGHEQEAHLLHRSSQIVCRPGQVEHDAAISLLAEANQLIVLADDLTSSTREVESEGGLIGAKVVDIEDQLLRQELWVTPDDPSVAD